MDTRRFGSDFSGSVGRTVLILVLVIIFVIGLGVVSGPIIAHRELQTKENHIRSIEQMVADEDWSGVRDYLSDNDLYDYVRSCSRCTAASKSEKTSTSIFL